MKHVLQPLLLSFSIRFLFILLGPKGKAKSYHEIGRAIATLMSDEVGKPDTRMCDYLVCVYPDCELTVRFIQLELCAYRALHG